MRQISQAERDFPQSFLSLCNRRPTLSLSKDPPRLTFHGMEVVLDGTNPDLNGFGG
jgi:hypothetical protein